jgi:SAM-dependent methyltransferase
LPDVKLIQLDASQMLFNNQFDTLGAFDVIEHISDDEKVLKNCYMALKPGGHIYITVPQFMFMWTSIDDMSHHKRRYSKHELICKTESAGFEILFCSSFVFTLFPLMLLSRLLFKKKLKSTSESKSELYPGKFVNAILSFLLKIDEYLIRAGISLPWGGSLVLVGQKKEIQL